MARNRITNCVSLGFFCSVAEEMEKNGFRSFSSPFDWSITEFEGVIKAINTGFRDFLMYDNLYQDTTDKSRYLDGAYNFVFFHDFVSYLPLKWQIKKVKDKYAKRIKKFFIEIKNPTLFLRYVKNQKEADFINNNKLMIESTIKSFNQYNRIVFIANYGVNISDVFDVYYVKSDQGDCVSRHFFNQAIGLKEMINKNYDGDKKSNIAFFKKKMRKKHKHYSKTFANKYLISYKHKRTFTYRENLF